MGISNFFPLVRFHAPNAIYEVSLNNFKGKRVAVDVSILAHYFFRTLLPIFVVENEDPDGEFYFLDKEGLKRRWLRKMFEFFLEMMKVGMVPVFVFDGRSLPIKKVEQQKREKQRQRQEELFQEAKQTYFESIGKFERNNAREKFKNSYLSQIRFDHSLLEELRQRMVAMNFCVLQSVEESDFLIASLHRDRMVDACYSVDTDLPIYGISCLIIKIRFGQAEIFDLSKFLELTEFSQSELVDLAILMGTDYNDGIPGVGWKTAFKLIDQYRKLELLPSKHSQKSLRRTLLRKRFLDLPEWQTLVEEKNSNLNWDFDLEKMKEDYGFYFSQLGIENKL